MARSIVITGVGGQGLITAGRVIGEALMSSGYNVVVAEVHGLSQRGGSVVVQVRYGRGELAPIVPPGTADLLIGLELIEAVRRVGYLSPTGTALVSDFLLPPPCSSPPSKTDLIEYLEQNSSLVLVPAVELAKRAGNPLSQNVVMLGVACGLGLLDADRNAVLAAINRVLGAKAGVNVRAFHEGVKWAKSYKCSGDEGG